VDRRADSVAKWYSTNLASRRPFVQTPTQPKKKKKKEKDGERYAILTLIKKQQEPGLVAQVVIPGLRRLRQEDQRRAGFEP
jgi:hypothetical protein